MYRPTCSRRDGGEKGGTLGIKRNRAERKGKETWIEMLEGTRNMRQGKVTEQKQKNKQGNTDEETGDQ
jgi:hypothetical protein